MDQEIENKLKAEAAKLEAEAKTRAMKAVDQAEAFAEKEAGQVTGYARDHYPGAVSAVEDAAVKVRSVWEKYPFLVVIVVLAILLVLCYFVADWAAARKYENQMQKASQAIQALQVESASHKAEADAFKQQAQAAEQKLPEINQRLADLDQRASNLVVATQKVRAEYDKRKSGNTTDFVFTGNSLTDMRRLCADLDAIGHTCKPS